MLLAARLAAFLYVYMCCVDAGGGGGGFQMSARLVTRSRKIDREQIYVRRRRVGDVVGTYPLPPTSVYLGKGARDTNVKVSARGVADALSSSPN